MGDFKDLVVWQRAHTVACGIYRVTRAFPPDEQFGLTSQLRRAGGSISANIAESCGRHGRREQVQLLRIAVASSLELESHLRLARDIGILEPERHTTLANQLREVQRMLSALIRHRSGGSGK